MHIGCAINRLTSCCVSLAVMYCAVSARGDGASELLVPSVADIDALETFLGTGSVVEVASKVERWNNGYSVHFPATTNSCHMANLNRVIRAVLPHHPLPNIDVFEWGRFCRAKSTALLGLPDFVSLETNTIGIVAAEFRWTVPYQTTNLNEYVGAETQLPTIANWVHSFNEDKLVYREALLMGFSTPLRRYFTGFENSERDQVISNFVNSAGLSDKEIEYIFTDTDEPFLGVFDRR